MKLENLKPGQSLATKVRKIKNNKVEVEIASFCERNGVINVASIFNAGDDRFAQNKPRRAWQAGEAAAIAGIFNLDVAKLTALAEGSELEINILNPSIPTSTGKAQLNVQVKEYTMSEIIELRDEAEAKGYKTDRYDYLIANAEERAKKNPATGEHVLVNNEYVFSTVSIVAGAPTHKWVNKADYEVKTVATDKSVAINVDSL